MKLPCDAGYACVQTHLFLFVCLFVYVLFLRETERKRGRAEREGDTECEAGSRLRAVRTESDAGLEFTHREIVT